jgi:general stress protein 26
MSKMGLSEIAEKMKKIDFAMLSTRTDGGAVAGRPMSNNGEVEYTGTSFFFSYDSARTIADIKNNPQVGLAFAGAKTLQGLIGIPPLFVAVQGKAEVIHDKATFAEHWTKGLDHWFKEGIDTPGLVLIKVEAERLHYWDGEDEGEVPL